MALIPRYYVPKGEPVPSHIRNGLTATRTLPGVGPDKAGEGLCIGGDFRTNDDWKLTADGWYIALSGCEPTALRRTFLWPSAAVSRSTPTGAHVWLVPDLLTIQADGAPGYAITERRDYQWKPPAAIEGVADRLRAAMDGSVPDADEVALVADILALNYHISRHELELAGWLTPELILAILKSASGIAAAESAHG